MIMSRIPSILSILILLAIGACTFTAPDVIPPTSPPIFETEIPTEAMAEPTEALASGTETSAAPQAAVTDTPALTAQPTNTLPPPTPVPPSATPAAAYPEPATQAPQPTATQPKPTATPVATLNPTSTYGKPSYQNPMNFPNPGEWAEAETGDLPDTDNLRLQFIDGELYVTGKRPGFSTWWFTYHTLSDAYIEMTFDTENCSGEDAYGIIFRGPPHKAGESYGYVVYFSCSGDVVLFRLDSADPFETKLLLDEEEVDAVNTGPNEENVIGVRAVGDQIAVYANDVLVGEVEDDEFAQGRVGVFVRAASPDDYSYRLTNFAYWTLGENK